MRLSLLLLLFILLMAEKNNAQALLRGPYMHMATGNSIVIRWRTDSACDSQVRYGTDQNNLNTVATTAALVNDHVFTLSNLTPDTKYYYSIGTSMLVLQGDTQNFFRTAPITSATYDKPVRFWAVGDMAKNTPHEAAMIAAFKKYVDTNYINGFILLGDNAYEAGQDMEYQNGFFNYFQPLIKHIVLWPCLGNHDYANDYNKRINYQIPYFDIFSNPQNGEMGGVPSNNERYYSHNFGNIHFINLDSYGLEHVNGSYYALYDTAYSPQYQWLKNDLSLNTLPWVIVSYHHPPYCMGTHNSDAEGDLVALRTNVNPLFEKYNVDLVLAGHCHTYQRSNLIRNHFGMEATYDSALHLVQNTSGRYDGSPNSCMYIKNNHSQQDTGVIYMVVGSGSAPPQAPQVNWPHNAMQYSNHSDNGSLYVTVQGNELHAAWISTDTGQVIKDHFTILKKANQFKTIYCHYPDTVKLKANWYTPPFIWSTGDTSQTIAYYATADAMLYVTDPWNCIRDTFQILSAATAILPASGSFEASIYPNPTDDELVIVLPATGLYDLTVMNPQGGRVFHENIICNDKTLHVRLKDKIGKGQYILSIKNDKNHVFTSKITLTE